MASFSPIRALIIGVAACAAFALVPTAASAAWRAMKRAG